MQSRELDVLIREHARQIDAEAPHARFDDLVGPRSTLEQAGTRPWRLRARGPVVAFGVAIAVVIAVGAGLVLVGPGSETVPADQPAPPTLPTRVDAPPPEPTEPEPAPPPVVVSVPETTIDPPPTMPPTPDPALPLEWVRYEVEGWVRAGAVGPSGIAIAGLGDFVDDYGFTMDGGFARWSVNGESWLEVLEPGFESPHLATMLYGGGRYVAAGGAEAPFYSTDGVTWTVADHMDDVWEDGEPQWADGPGNVMGRVHAIAYGDGRYVAVGQTIEFPADPAATDWDTIDYPAAWVSFDAVTWERAQDAWEGGGSGVPGQVWVSDVIFDGERFLASGNRDAALSNDFEGTIWESPDGTTWSLVDSAEGCSGSLAYGSAGYVALGSEGFGGEGFCHSRDGVSWSRFDEHIGDDVAFGGGVYLAVGWDWVMNADGTRPADGEPFFKYSTDGVTWTRVAGGPELFGRTDSCGNDFAIQAFSVSYRDGRFVVLGVDNGPMVMRDDGPWPCPDAEGSSYVWIADPGR